MTDMVAVCLLSNLSSLIMMLLVYTLNRYLCAELTLNYFLKMLGEIKRFILNINLKKYPRQIQHPTTDLKLELVVKLLMTLNCKLFFQKDLF